MQQPIASQPLSFVKKQQVLIAELFLPLSGGFFGAHQLAFGPE